jgi:hypothetical protein
MSAEWKPVKLAAKVIGHISTGMYRTPAGAIKELVSNAYDAGANYVKIHTGFPTFGTFSCEDDGSGILKSKFQTLMEGGIGDSDKQTTIETRFGKNGRPIIGRLGVGLLSLGQVCSQFQIRSYHGETREAFEAEIKFPPYSRQEIDRIITATKQDPSKLIKHGEYRISNLDYEDGRSGIIVTTGALRDMFRKTMSQLQNYANKRVSNSLESYGSFYKFLDAVVTPSLGSLTRASQYDQLLFGLALASPLPYPDAEDDERETVLLQIPEVLKLQRTLKSYKFRLEVDNVELRRPLLLPSNKDRVDGSDCQVGQPESVRFQIEDGVYRETVAVKKYKIKVSEKDETYQLYYFEYSKKVNGYPLTFSGYIFLQTSRLFPKELQGVVVRIRHVAIGQYDASVMNYPLAEGPRFSMLSAEVFVEEGLDDALKVDRDGFNTLDPQYIRLQSFIHSILHNAIFPGSWEEEKERNKQRRETRDEASLSNFNSSLNALTDGRIKRMKLVSRDAAPEPEQFIEIDEGSRAVTIYEGHPDAREFLGRKKNRALANRIAAAFAVANREGSTRTRQELFYRLIGRIFNE